MTQREYSDAERQAIGLEYDEARWEFSRAAAEFKDASDALERAERRFNEAIEREEKAREAIDALPFKSAILTEGDHNG